MKSRGGRFLLFLGVGLAVLAFVAVYVVMSKGAAEQAQTASVPTVVPLRTVAVVSQDLPAYTVLDASNVATADVDASSALSNTVTDPSALYGKMITTPLIKGQQIQMSTLTQSGFSDVLAKGQKAFVLAVPERDTFGNAVTEGDHVDVVWSVALEYYEKVPDSNGQFHYQQSVYSSTKTLLQNVAVVRVIDLRAPVPQTQGNNSNTSGGAQQTSANSNTAQTANPNGTSALYDSDAPYQEALVLGVTDQQAEVLKFARENGSLDFTLRSSAPQKNPDGSTVKDAQGQDVKGDQDVEKTTGISIDQLIKEYGIITPASQGQ